MLLRVWSIRISDAMLVYGLAFSKCKIKLSYIKNAPDQENELYYLLKVLNATPKPYILDTPNAARKMTIISRWKKRCTESFHNMT